MAVSATKGRASDKQEIDSKLLSQNIGKQVIISTTHGTYQGNLIHVDHKGGLLLSKVEDLESGKKRPGVQLYVPSEILRVELQKEKDKHPASEIGQEPATGRESSRHASGDHAEVSDEQLLPLKEWRDMVLSHKTPVAKKLEANSGGTEQQHTMLQMIEKAVEKPEIHCTVIDQLQTMFNLAISHIQCQPAIGIAAAGTNVCRHGKLCWLQVASKSHVYLFDITILGPTVFQRGLKTVLEDENVIKVIHDCRGLSDCLYHQYGVALSNVFDTQVADIFLFHMDTGGFLPQRPSTLEECLSKRLNLPHSLLSALTHAQGIVKDNQLLWSLHPMPHSLQKALALETFYVLSLHRTMRSAMMADFNTLVNGYIKVYTQDSDDVLKWTELSTTHLPVDFHTMNSLQAKRKEKALKSFVVDKHGLLVQPENHQDLFGEDRKRTEDSVLELSDPPQCQQIETTPQPTSNKDLDKWDACSEPFNPDPLVRQEIKCQDDPILQNPIASPRLALLNQHFSQLQLASLPEVKPKQIQFRPAAPLMVPRVRMAASQLLAQTRHKYVTQDTP